LATASVFCSTDFWTPPSFPNSALATSRYCCSFVMPLMLLVFSLLLLQQVLLISQLFSLVCLVCILALLLVPATLLLM
jgi:hypothetical protein